MRALVHARCLKSAHCFAEIAENSEIEKKNEDQCKSKDEARGTMLLWEYGIAFNNSCLSLPRAASQIRSPASKRSSVRG